MQLTMTADEARLRDVVGTNTFLRAREYARSGAVLNPRWRGRGAHVFGQVQGTARRPYDAMAVVGQSPDGDLTSFRGTCTCPVGVNCKHSVALLLAVLPTDHPGEGGDLPSEWESSLDGLIGAERHESVDAPGIALQFELGPAHFGDPALHVGVRPVLPGKNGGWIRTGVSWASVEHVGWGRHRIAADHLRLLAEIRAMDPYARSGGGGHVVHLDALPTRRIWDVLTEARDAGLPLVQTGRDARPVRVRDEPAELALDVSRSETGLALSALVRSDGEPVPLGELVLLGDPAHGAAWCDPAGLVLAPFAAAIDAARRRLIEQRTVLVPHSDEARFFADYYPAVRSRVAVISADDSVELPDPQPPVLVLSVGHHDGPRTTLEWQWRYTVGASTRPEPLWPEPGRYRDHRHEATVLTAAQAITDAMAALGEPAPGGGHRLAASRTLEGIEAVRFDTELLPRLFDLADAGTIEVEVAGAAPTFREAEAGPVIELGGQADPDDRDWFDLAVTVSVDGEDVPFGRLFVALSEGDSHLVLDSGVYFTLDRPEFRALAELIAEARELLDPDTRTVRLSRYQAGLWDELDRLGVISGQAAEWQRAVRTLTRLDELPEPAVPASLHAVLRPYQHTGFAWLTFLYEHRLGGILADDMGLGKTLQTLALICHAKQHGHADAPFLVVAPTSVVSNWAAECARFAPDLSVETITETGRRRSRPLADVVRGADVVITSYTLFRLEFDSYERQRWAALILDEAQFVKNHQSQAHHCAKRLSAPVKVAITGTPMENNLMELWSLLSITAPGLFPSPVAFEKDYRTPIERRRDPESVTPLLSRLRDRVRPFMLRRAKEDVARDLPDKQEQVIELTLNREHRQVYETHLQRERQKVLGLLDDLDGNRFEIFRSLTLLRQACLDAALVDPAYAAVPSTKLDVLLERLTEIAGEGHRTLVFSQFTRFLDAARQRLDAAGIDYCYLDGKTRNRRAVLNEFKSGYAPVFLISLKAGGFGLNLTEADYCILLDPWWNPATEAQAVDRVHRIGQTKNVMVYRFVAKDTIEQKVMALKAAKAELVSSVLGEGDFSSGALTASDIRSILA